MKRSRFVTWLVLALLVALLAVPAIAFAGGDQVQYGRPDTTPFTGSGDRTGGDWGSPSNSR